VFIFDNFITYATLLASASQYMASASQFSFGQGLIASGLGDDLTFPWTH